MSLCGACGAGYNDKVHSDIIIIIIISERMSPACAIRFFPFFPPKKLLVLMNYAYIDNNFLVSFCADCIHLHLLAPFANLFFRQ